MKKSGGKSKSLLSTLERYCCTSSLGLERESTVLSVESGREKVRMTSVGELGVESGRRLYDKQANEGRSKQ